MSDGTVEETTLIATDPSSNAYRPGSGDIQAVGQASERRRSACNRSIVPVVVGNLDDAMLVSGVGLPMAVSMFK